MTHLDIVDPVTNIHQTIEGTVTDALEEKGIYHGISYSRNNEKHSFRVPRGHMLRSIELSSKLLAFLHNLEINMIVRDMYS